MTLPEPNGSFAWVQVGDRPALVCPALTPFAAHLFTTRAWRLSSSVGTPPHSAFGRDDEAWDEVGHALGGPRLTMVRARQVHGRSVMVHRRRGYIPSSPPDADIIVSDDESVALAIQTADCVPLVMVDAASGAVAAAHAGWRGLAARVPHVTVEAMRREFGSRPDDLIVAAGPAIGACCYQVGPDVRAGFEAAGFPAHDISRWFLDRPRPTAVNPSAPGLACVFRQDRWFLDVWQATRDSLEAAGVPPDRIHLAELCTASHDVFCSYRRDGAGAGRMAAAIGRGPRVPRATDRC